MTDSAYAESEAQFKALRRAEYQDWVLDAFPWKVWNLPWFAFGGWQWSLVSALRAPGDPERSSREARRKRGEGYGVQYESLRRLPVAEWEKIMLKATKDGRPRTLNRIAVEAVDLTADILPHNAVEAYYKLLYEQKLAFAFINFDDPLSPMSVWAQKTPHPYILLWNDAGWRRRHPDAPPPAYKVLGQMVLERRELPSEGRI